MKIAIITITDGCNYGNRLQNYALQTICMKYNAECETIRRKTSRDVSCFNICVDRLKDAIKFLLKRKTNRVYRLRKKIFCEFNDKYIYWSRNTLKYNLASKDLNFKYDYFICGSDQIWNVKFDVIKEDILNYLAFFAAPEKRIAYAASFGSVDIDSEYKDYFINELPKFKAISVREKSGKQIIKDLVDINTTVVLDPTMLLTTDEWQAVSTQPRYVKNNIKFIVTYFMSGRSDEITEYIQTVKRFYNCETVINLDMEFTGRSAIENEDHFCTSPTEFLWLINHSCAVLTDSFHATVFSLLFHKPFCVFQRKAKEKGNEMGSRIDTLLGYFGMEDYLDDINHPTRLPKSYDGNMINQVLTNKRLESIDFLINSLGINITDNMTIN